MRQRRGFFSEINENTNPNEIENLRYTVQLFNNELQQAGLNSSYLLNFNELMFNDGLNSRNSDVRVYTVHKYEHTIQDFKSHYTLSISMNTETGEVDKVGVLVQDGERLKEIIQSAITALIQDIEVSRQFSEKHKLFALIDNAPNGRYSSVKSVADDRYEGTYYLLKLFQEKKEGEDDELRVSVTHAFEIKRL